MSFLFTSPYYVICHQQNKGGKPAPFADSEGSACDSQQHARVDGMAKPRIRARAYELVVRLDLNLVAPVMAEMPPRPDHQRNAETGQRHPQISNGWMIGNERSCERPHRQRWRQQKHKRHRQDEQPQDTMRMRLSCLRGVPGGCAGTENPIQASRSPQPNQHGMSLSWSRGLLLRIVRVADRCLGLAGDCLR